MADVTAALRAAGVSRFSACSLFSTSWISASLELNRALCTGSRPGMPRRHPQFVRGQHQISTHEVVLGHVVVRVAGIAGGARGQCDQPHLLGRWRHGIEQVQQYPMSLLGAVMLHQGLCVVNGQRHIAWEQAHRLSRTSGRTPLPFPWPSASLPGQYGKE